MTLFPLALFNSLRWIHTSVKAAVIRGGIPVVGVMMITLGAEAQSIPYQDPPGQFATITVEITGTKPNIQSGPSTWDVAPFEAPDIAICLFEESLGELRSEIVDSSCLPDGTPLEQIQTPACPDAYRCVFTNVALPSNSVKIAVVDVDLSVHEMIGVGECEINRSCLMGQAKLTITPTPPVCQFDPDQAGSDPTPEADLDWDFILSTFRNFYQSHSQNPATAAFAHQMLNIAERSYINRKEIGQWAGSLTRSILLQAAHDINTNSTFWINPPYRSGLFESGSQACSAVESIVSFDCGFVMASHHHIERHLQPAFNTWVATALQQGLQTCPYDPAQATILTIRSIETEHQLFLSEAVVPGLDPVHELSSFWRLLAQQQLPQIASYLRSTTIDQTITQLVTEGQLSEADQVTIYQRLGRELPIQPGGSPEPMEEPEAVVNPDSPEILNADPQRSNSAPVDQGDLW